MSLLDSAATVDDVIDRINKRHEELFHKEEDGTFVPLVCTFCDHYLIERNDTHLLPVAKLKQKAVMKLFSWEQQVQSEERIPTLETYYSFSGSTACLNGDVSWLEGLCLSPRGRLRTRDKGRGANKYGFTCCTACNKSIEKKRMPLWAIINKNYIGCAPACLQELTEVELTMLTPVHKHGYSFTYTGGKMNALKATCTMMRVEQRVNAKSHKLHGTLNLMRADEERIARAATQLQCMGLTNHILIVITGKMTEWQKKRAQEKTTIRTNKLIEAVTWLCGNHRKWKSIDLEKMREELKDRQPVVRDLSELVESVNANVEEEELFSCYYPDSATDEMRGGFDEPGAFKEYVESMAQQGYDVEFKINLQKHFVNNDNNDQLMNASLLQFPYGVGGHDEKRIVNDKRSDKIDLNEFMDHLSRKSEPSFQTPMMQLLMYSQISKVRLLQSSRLQVRGKADAQTIANGFDAEDLRRATTQRVNGMQHGGTRVARRILQSVDATSRALPHTNAAAKKARMKGEAMQHHFGQASVFLTATFDDENSFLMQVLTGELVDDVEDIASLSDSELESRGVKRRTLRLNFPGIAAINFEILMDILVEEVVGWDRKKSCKMTQKGLFGEPFAFTYCVEEQGRKTLHAHMSIWIEGYARLQQALFFGKEKEKLQAARELKKYFDHVATTKMFPEDHNEILIAFEHDCTEPARKKRKLPTVVSEQDLRNQRHRKGYAHANGLFANCPDCTKTWTYEQMVADFIIRTHGFCVPIVEDDPPQQTTGDEHLRASTIKRIVPKNRLWTRCIQFQRPGTKKEDTPLACINAAYQHHLSCHVEGCFKCQKSGKGSRKSAGHTCGPNCECRYRLPDRKRKYSDVMTAKESVPWFTWRGTSKPQPLVQLLPKRGTYDLYQNVSCKAISESKFTCNSNVSVITDGPISQYIFKYIFSGTQEEDTAEYGLLNATMKRVTGRQHDDDRLEAVRLIRRAAFAHNKKNVLNAPMASYLTRHDSRFYFSHEFTFCPLIDLVKLHDKQHVECLQKFDDDGTTFFENQALHYLCRPLELESISAKTFSECYKVSYVSKSKLDEDKIFRMCPDTGFYQHPSVTKVGRYKGQCKQGVEVRAEFGYCSVSQWSFPDTATFGDDILTCDVSNMNKKMELYAQHVLTLFYPHRSAGDLQVSDVRYPYVMKMREVFEEDEDRRLRGEIPILFTDANCQFLQNIQNAARNSLRYKIENDELQGVTIPFKTGKDVFYGDEDFEDDRQQEEEEEEDETNPYEDFLELIDSQYEVPTNDKDPDVLPQVLQHLSFETLRDAGRKDCGYHGDMQVPTLTEEQKIQNEVIFNDASADDAANTNSTSDIPLKERKKYSMDKIVEVLMRRTASKVRNVFDDVNIDVPDATGSVKSIRQWAKAAFKDDRKQARAFESIIAAFLLTFYDEKPETHTAGVDQSGNAVRLPLPQSRSIAKFRQARKALLRLKGQTNLTERDDQLVCLLHGPAGSGKSTVINLVQAYARSFCESLGHPYTPKTIVVTAMSGVAATLLHGETAHSILGINRNKMTVAEQEQFADTRLLFIDEISFASDGNLETMQDHICQLMREFFKMYGGLSIVFAGDYSQLEPVRQKGTTVYNVDYCPEFHGMLNCFIELDGMHRFKDDPEWGLRLRRFREGEPTLEDIRFINENCDVAEKPPPLGIQVASYYNQTRDAVNAAFFEQYCSVNEPQAGAILNTACLIFMDNLRINNHTKTPVPVTSNEMKRIFYTTVGEDGCKIPKSVFKNRVDPVLKLYHGCPMMHTENTDVSNGQANGTRTFLEKVIPKIGEQPFVVELACGTKVWGLLASQVKCIRVRHVAKDIKPETFDVKPTEYTFSCVLDFHGEVLKASMKGQQFPLISNTCTTGHKLQGCTVDSILVNEWFYGQNWAYVVLSRVKTMAGLYLRERLSEKLSNYAMSAKMKMMLAGFRDLFGLTALSEEEYAELERATEFLDEVVVNGDVSDDE